jgi:ParB family transcriptional regulator, chromosome partitioning protein
MGTEQALSKGSFYWFSPGALTLVRNPDHPLFDVRALEPPDPKLVESLAEFGNRHSVKIQSVKSYKDENGKVHKDVMLVADGRRRTIAAQFLEGRQKKSGTPDAIRLKCEFVKGSGEVAPVHEMVIGNSHRKPENPAELARKAVRLTNMGRSQREISNLFGVDESTVKNWLSLGTGPEEVLNGVQQGTVSASAGYALSKSTPEEARALLAGSNGKVRAAAVKAKVKKSRTRDVTADGEGDSAKRLSVAALNAMLEAFEPGTHEKPGEDSVCDVVKCTLEFILGIDPKARGLAEYKDSSAAKLARKIRA